MAQQIDKFRERFRGEVSRKSDPFFPTIAIKFDFFPRIIKGESVEPGLINGVARSFLNERGDSLRVVKLDYFVSMLKFITLNEPWYINGISGLDTLMKLNLENGRRLPENAKITIGLKESVDLKIMSMIDAYRSTVIDKKYMRQVLPKNLMRFDMKVYVTDTRVFVDYKKGEKDSYTFSLQDDVAGVMVFNLYDCQFVMDDFADMLGTLSNENTNPETKHKIDIIVGRIYEQYTLPTERPMGFMGDGYSSHDFDSDYNFLGSILRQPSLNVSELGRVVDLERNADNVTKGKRKLDEIEIESTDQNRLDAYKDNFLNRTQPRTGGLGGDGKKVTPFQGDLPTEFPIESTPNKVELGSPESITSADNKTTLGDVSIDSVANKTELGEIIVDSVGNKTTIGDVTVESNPNKTELGEISIESTPNKTNITNMQIESTPNKTFISRLDIESAPNKTTLGDLSVESSPNKTTLGDLSVESNSNKTTLGDLSLESAPNRTTLGDLEIESTENSTKLGSLSIESNPNKTFISRLEIESTPNKTELGSLSIESNPNRIEL